MDVAGNGKFNSTTRVLVLLNWLTNFQAKKAGIVFPPSTPAWVFTNNVRLVADRNIRLFSNLITVVGDITIQSKKGSIFLNNSLLSAGDDLDLKAKQTIEGAAGLKFVANDKCSFKANDFIILSQTDINCNTQVSMVSSDLISIEGAIKALDPQKGTVKLKSKIRIFAAGSIINAGKLVDMNSGKRGLEF